MRGNLDVDVGYDFVRNQGGQNARLGIVIGLGFRSIDPSVRKTGQRAFVRKVHIDAKAIDKYYPVLPRANLDSLNCAPQRLRRFGTEFNIVALIAQPY